MIFWCYKGVGEVFWGWNDLKIKFFFFTKRGIVLIFRAPLWWSNSRLVDDTSFVFFSFKKIESSPSMLGWA